MSGHGDGLGEPTAERKTGQEENEERMLREGRRLSVWAIVGALVLVAGMVALAFGVWTSGGPNPTPADPSGEATSTTTR
ncbi:hypothetical protein ASC97_16315 [Rhizobium sp. Root1203]|uniref:hypothetical protein n=1 Tax=Rhizobium sp. Root1203 TaxID=1736427 RepID=UPI00070C1328|nr:hypothetical protein [Rhizobium sp. Root1203]KQV10871.1 hypothetical protein ASC97_16315 [Rhizobium sp. Root1203]